MRFIICYKSIYLSLFLMNFVVYFNQAENPKTKEFLFYIFIAQICVFILNAINYYQILKKSVGSFVYFSEKFLSIGRMIMALCCITILFSVVLSPLLWIIWSPLALLVGSSEHLIIKLSYFLVGFAIFRLELHYFRMWRYLYPQFEIPNPR